MQKALFNKNIHGLRGFAVLSVFLFHVYTFALADGIVLPDGYAWLGSIFSSLAAGVDIFYMISGYLIIASIIRHKNAKNFLIDRFIRIYPAFLVVECFLFLIAPRLHTRQTAEPVLAAHANQAVGLTRWEPIYHFITNLLLLPGVFPIAPILGPAWSLSYEFLFYFFVAALYFFWSRKRRVVPVLLMAIIVPLLLYFYPRMIGFVGGALVYYLTQLPKKQEDHPDHHYFERYETVNALKSLLSFLAVIAFILFLTLLSFTLMSPFRGNLTGAPRNWLSDIGAAEDSFIWLAYFAAPFGAFFFFNVVNGTKIFVKLFQSPFLQRMGTISYSFYLWHWVVLSIARPVLVIVIEKTNFFYGMVINVVFIWLVTYGISYTSYRLLEKRAGTLLKKYFGKSQSAATGKG